MALSITPTLSIDPAPTTAPAAPAPFESTTPGIIANTVKGITGNVPITENPWLKVAADIGQGIARTVGSVGLTAQNYGTKVINKVFSQPALKSLGITGGVELPSVPVPHYLTPIFGDGGDIKDVPTRIADAAAQIKANPFAQKLGLDQHATPLAFGAVIGNTALDLAGMGGEKGAVSALAKETDPAVISTILTKIGLNADAVAKFAPDIAAATNETDVKNILDVAKSVHGLSEIAKGQTSTLDLYQKTRNPNLPEAMKPVEQAAYGHIESQGGVPNLVDQYIAKNGTTVNTDNARELFPGYAADRSLSAAVHEPASVVTKAVYERLLETEVGKRDNTVLFTGGGTGAGKTTALEALGDHNPAITYDGNLSSFSSSVKKIDAALKHGYNVDIHYVYRDPVDALVNGALPRAERMTQELGSGRTVPLNEHMNTHIGTPSTALKLAEHYKGNDKVNIRAVDNSHGLGNAKPVDPLDFFKGKRYNKGNAKELTQKAQEALDAEFKAGRISEATYRGSQETEGKGGRPKPSDGGQSQQKLPEHAVTPAHTVAELTQGKDGASWNSIIKGFSRNLPKEAKVHALDYLATPEFVLEKIGLGKGAEMLQDAKNLYRENLGKEISKIQDWRKVVGKDPYASTRIFRYLDGRAKEVFAEMTDTEKRVAKEMKAYLASWADRLKLPEDSRISNYITHIFDDGAVAGKPSVFEEDPELASIMGEKVAGSVYDPFTTQRLGKKGYKEDVWAALDAYVKRGTRKEAMDPALEYLKKEAGNLDQASYDYVKSLSHRINMRPTKIDSLFDNLIKATPGLNRIAKGPRPTMFLTRKIRNIFYRGTLGLNFGSALRNLSQGANTYAKLGEKYTIIGYAKTFSRLLTNNFDELKRVGVLSDELMQDKKVGVYKSLIQKADPLLFSMFEITEKLNRGAAYFGAKSKGLAKGLSEEEAVKYAQRMVRETQFAFGNVDSPVILASDIAKTASQLGTYTVKQVEFLTRMAKNKEFAGLVRYTIASMAFIYSLGKIFGMKATDAIPSIGTFGQSPIGNLVSGLAGLASTNTQTQTAAQTQVKSGVVSLIPAGAQIRKTVQGITAYNKGRDTTPTGKTRFRIPKTKTNLIRAAVFGKSSLPEAQAYYNSIGKKKKSSGKVSI